METQSEGCGELDATLELAVVGSPATPVRWRAAWTAWTKPSVARAPVPCSTEGFPPGTNPSTPRWPRGTKRTAPSHRQLWAPGSPPPSCGHLEGPPVETGSAACLSSHVCVHVPRCVPCCAWSVPRPYTYVCVYVCVCRCALTCLSFLCMCRSGVWLSCRLCVLVPLFGSEQRLVSLVPFPEVLTPSPSPPQEPHAVVGLPAQQAAPPTPCQHLHFRLWNQSWPSCPCQARLLGPNVRRGSGRGKNLGGRVRWCS